MRSKYRLPARRRRYYDIDLSRLRRGNGADADAADEVISAQGAHATIEVINTEFRVIVHFGRAPIYRDGLEGYKAKFLLSA